MQELRDRFNGVQVMFRSPGEKSDVVTIRGPKDDVEKCAKHLRKLVDDLVSLKICTNTCNWASKNQPCEHTLHLVIYL